MLRTHTFTNLFSVSLYSNHAYCKRASGNKIIPNAGIPTHKHHFHPPSKLHLCGKQRDRYENHHDSTKLTLPTFCCVRIMHQYCRRYRNRNHFSIRKSYESVMVNKSEEGWGWFGNEYRRSVVCELRGDTSRNKVQTIWRDWRDFHIFQHKH